MNQPQTLMAVGAFLYGALYLTFCLCAGFILAYPFVWKLAIASAGFAFLAFVLQLSGVNKYICGTAVAASIVAGALSGLALVAR